MDLEAGIYKDDPEFEGVIDSLSNSLFQISSNNGRIAESLRRAGRGAAVSGTSSDQLMTLVQENQLNFRQLKGEVEEMQLWRDPTPSQKYSQHKLASDFARLFQEFRRLQEQVINHARAQPPPQLPLQEQQSAIELSYQASDLSEPPLAQQQAFAIETVDFDEQLRQDEVSYQQGLVAEREQEIEYVAQGMNELNEIFESLGEIVREQGSTLDNIESNMYSVASNVYSGSQQLVKAHRWQRATSGRMCCFLIILLVMLLVVVIAVSF